MTWKIHIHIYMGVSLVVHGCVQAISWLFQENYKIISRVFQCDSWVCNGSARSVLRVFLSIWVCMGSCHGISMQSKPFFDKKHPKTPLKHDAHTFESFCKHSKMNLKHTSNTCQNPLKHQWNTILKIVMYFPCHNNC